MSKISGAAEAALATKSNTLANEQEKKFERHRTRIHETLPDWFQEDEMEE